MNLLWTSGLLLLIYSVTAELLDSVDHSNEICYLCACNADRTSVDCSHRGLTVLPTGIDAKVKIFFYYETLGTCVLLIG